MLNAQKLGQRLSMCRKEKGLTQAEMADALHISYQAVSSWERGETMPDIVKLPDIAGLLSVSMDDLLGMMKPSYSGAEEQPVKDEAITRQEDGNVHDGIKVEDAAGEPCESEAAKAEDGDTLLKKAMSMIPFIDRASAGMIVENLMQRGIPIPIMDCLPFIDRQTAEKLVIAAMDRDASAVMHNDVLPFVGKEAADRVVSRLMQENEDIDVIDYLPFISRSMADTLVLREIARGKPADPLMETIPFLTRQGASHVAQYLSSQGVRMDLHDLLPFVERSMADELIRMMIERGDKVDADVLPFVSRPMAGELAKRIFGNP